MRQNKAYILIFTIVMLSLITILTHQLLRLVYVGSNFDTTMVDRERAEMLALGGINLAIAQLTQPKDKKKKQENKTEDKDSRVKKEFDDYLFKVLSNLNRWQVFPLKEDIDKISGEVKICISCENGKININEAFDFKKKEFKPAYKKLLARLKVSGKNASGAGNFLKQLTDFFKKRNKKLEDISQLQSGLKASISKLFYEPPQRSDKPKRAKPNKGMALQDLFTIWTRTDKLEGLYLSDALCNLLSFRRPRAHDAQLRKGKFKSVIKKFKTTLDQNKPEYWKIVNPLYETKTAFKIGETKIFSPKFEPTTYSVLSSGKVGTVEQKLLAIIEEEPQDPNSKKKQKEKLPFRIVQLYWI